MLCREDLRLIISSATLNAERFSSYFDGAAIFTVPGRMFKVEVFYTKAPEADYLDACVVSALQVGGTAVISSSALFGGHRQIKHRVV